MKELFFVGTTLDDLRGFPKEVRREVGFQLDRVQNDLVPYNWKPFKIVGPSVREICIHIDGEHRVIYVANIRDSVYALHAFQKKTQKTKKIDIEIARNRFKQIKEA